MSSPRHLVVVEAYDGILELVHANPEERLASRGLGLPLGEIAATLHARITVLAWDDWLRYEATPGSFFDWIPFPATRALEAPGPALSREESPGVQYRSIPVRDPDHGAPLTTRGPSPMMYGLLAESDPLFLLSYCLHQFLERLLLEDPFQAVLLPMWGGLGYQAQMIRATGDSRLAEVAFASLVTDPSKHRHERNGEGLWTRRAITRRQMEDVSLALADGTFAFGARGADYARSGRLASSGDSVIAPRHLPLELISKLRERETKNSPSGAGFLVEEPLDAASGTLTALDAVALLWRKGLTLKRPLVCRGPEIRFAPMKPREFSEYWASRGFVQSLVKEGLWKWRDREESGDSWPIRIYPSHHEYLPSPWLSLAGGALPVLSPAAAQGLAPWGDFPGELLLDGELTPGLLARKIDQLAGSDVAQLTGLKHAMAESIITSFQSAGRKRAFESTVQWLDQLLDRPPAPQALDQVARIFLDPRIPLRELTQPDAPPKDQSNSLSVVVVCYNMGPLISETMESVWRSEKVPDEVILVDDGSTDPDTVARLAALESESRTRNLPLRILRQKNRGLAGARNAGLAEATGTFISFLDGDDLIEPAFYRLALDLTLRYPGLGGVAAWALCFGDGVPVGFWNAPQPELPLLLVENTIIVPCLVRTALLREVGGYDETQRYNYEDWELGVRLLVRGHPIVTIPRYLERYRMRPDSLYRTMSEVQNQGMRELMLGRHRETVARFSVEVAMQLEHRLMQRVYAKPASPIVTEAKKLAGNFRDLVASVSRKLGRG